MKGSGSTRTNTESEAVLLSLMQLSDSFFPTGMYTMSNGLETLHQENKIRDARMLKTLIKSYVTMQGGVTDCVALGNAAEAARRNDVKSMIRIDRTLYAMKLVKEMRDASIRSGMQLLGCICSFKKNNFLSRYRRAVASGSAHGTYPVALGAVSQVFGISKQSAALILLYSSSAGFVGAALRLGIIDHNEGQRIIDALKPAIHEASKNAGRPLRSMWQFFPYLEIAQMRHERIENKMFVT